MLPREMMLAVTASLWLAVRTDVMAGASGVSSPADESIEAAEVPTPQTQDVLPKAVPVALSRNGPLRTYLSEHLLSLRREIESG
jgi:hypothetical protein